MRRSLILQCLSWTLATVWIGCLAGGAAAANDPAADLRAAAQPTSNAVTMPSAPAASVPHGRPRIGLVLSGGGARGIAHVGVLKVLEQARVPIDVIAGTSMGAIIGGLYASGMTAAELEREMLAVRWDEVFASRVERQQLSQRRKEEDFEISPVLELGLRDGELRAPLGAVSSRGLESLLRRYTLSVGTLTHFDALPIPYRAVATDMETGLPVVLSDGDLALAMRSSMSVPGLFAPTEVGGRTLGDGGLVDNVPIDVARAMGADVLIVVNIGTPLAGRESLGSVTGLTTQMINILTEQNVQRSLATLRPGDLLITPDLGRLTSSDFAQTRQLIERGEAGAQPLRERLAAWGVDTAGYAQWRAQHAQAPAPRAQLDFVKLEGSRVSNAARVALQLESKAGEPFDADKAERDASRLAASGDYDRADYRLSATPAGEGLVFHLEDKPWGPNYFRIGLDMSTNFRGDSAFDIKISHNRHWLDANGSEWRNQVQIGRVPRWFTELYHPLNWSGSPANDWFVAAYAEIQRREQTVYDNDSGAEEGRFNRLSGRVGFDLGQPWGGLGEFRLGLTQVVDRGRAEIVAAGFPVPRQALTLHETGLRLGVVIDQLDYAFFPQRGWRVTGEIVTGRRRVSPDLGAGEQSLFRLETEATAVASWGAHTVNAYLRAQRADSNLGNALGRYTLGGFQQLSGYREGQLDGNNVLFGRLTYYMRLTDTPVFTRGFFLGGTLEAGNVWDRPSQARLSDLRTGMSLFVGAATGLGPVYFGVTYAPQGSFGVNLFIGRP